MRGFYKWKITFFLLPALFSEMSTNHSHSWYHSIRGINYKILHMATFLAYLLWWFGWMCNRIFLLCVKVKCKFDWIPDTKCKSHLMNLCSSHTVYNATRATNTQSNMINIPHNSNCTEIHSDVKCASFSYILNAPECEQLTIKLNEQNCETAKCMKFFDQSGAKCLCF